MKVLQVGVPGRGQRRLSCRGHRAALRQAGVSVSGRELREQRATEAQLLAADRSSVSLAEHQSQKRPRPSAPAARMEPPRPWSRGTRLTPPRSAQALETHTGALTLRPQPGKLGLAPTHPLGFDSPQPEPAFIPLDTHPPATGRLTAPFTAPTQPRQPEG